jgi:hypothetical protein
MPRVKNLTNMTVSVSHWKLLPDGRLLDPRGKVQDALPDSVAYGSATMRYAELGLLELEGYVTKKEREGHSTATINLSSIRALDIYADDAAVKEPTKVEEVPKGKKDKNQK